MTPTDLNVAEAASPEARQFSIDGDADRKGGIRRHARAAIILLALLGLLSGVIAFSSQARHQLALSFTEQPVKYTELYFLGNDPPVLGVTPQLSLGSQIEDRSVLEVSFNVANHEGSTTTFPYVVEVMGDAHESLGRVEDSVTVADGDAQNADVSVNVVAPQRWKEIEVRLVGRSEQIRFLRAD